MERADLDARAMVEELRAEVAGRAWAPTPRPPSELRPMVADPGLAYLHRHWALRRTLEPSRRRIPAPGPRGVLKVLVNRLTFGSLAPYLDEEQELLAHAVRLLDALARRCDAIVEAQAAELDALRADMVELAARLESRRSSEDG
ncbi:MAG: hypothetical protein ACRDY2_05845 [Acidimicrobiales bacterium]